MKTGLGENEILEAEEKFKEDYPDGRISLEEFVDQSDVSGGFLLSSKPKVPNLNVFAKKASSKQMLSDNMCWKIKHPIPS